MCFWPFNCCCRKKHTDEDDDVQESLIDRTASKHTDYSSFGALKFQPVHDAEKELQEVNHRKNYRNPDQKWFLIHAAWLSQWSQFVSHDGLQPGLISNNNLLVPGTKDKVRKDLRALIDWRIINDAVWNFYLKEYGGGPTILIKFPENISPEKLDDNLWLQTISIPELAVVFDSIYNSDPYLIDESSLEFSGATWGDSLGKQKIEKAKRMNIEIGAEQARALGILVTGDLAIQKEKQVEELSNRIDQQNVDLLGLELAEEVSTNKFEKAKKLKQEENDQINLITVAHFEADISSQMVRHGRELEAQAKSLESEINARAVVQSFASVEMQQAKQLEQEEKFQQSVGVGQLFVDDLASTKFEQARQLEELEKEQMRIFFVEQFISMSGIARVRAALKFGDKDLAEEAVAIMVQSAWRSKIARKELNRRRQEKERLLQEAATIKLQSVWRRKLVQRQIRALRIEKERKRQEAATLMLQCAWRSRLARRKVEELRCERQQMIQEHAALKLQCAYRCRIAKKNLQLLRKERQRLLEEGSAIRLQCAYRRYLARKKLEELKAEREKLRQEAAAIKLQTCWRCYIARKKVATLRAERQRLLEEGSTIRMQCAWRRYLARRKLEQLRKERMDQKATQICAVWRGKRQRDTFLRQKRAAVIVESRIRQFLSFKRVERLARKKPRPFVLHIISAKNLRIADINSSDPYIIVSAHKEDEEGKQSNQMLAKTRVISSNLNPVFHEHLLIGATCGDAKLVFTVCDYDLISNPDFLGQMTVDMKTEVPDIWRKESLPFVIERELRNFMVEPALNHSIMINEKGAIAQGSMKIEFMPCPAIYSFCGPLEFHKKKFATSEWVHCFGVLVFNRFQIFSSQYEQWKPIVDVNPKELHDVIHQIESHTHKEILNLFLMDKKKQKLVVSIRSNNLQEWKSKLFLCMGRSV